jgi:hypothetical protein
LFDPQVSIAFSRSLAIVRGMSHEGQMPLNAKVIVEIDEVVVFSQDAQGGLSPSVKQLPVVQAALDQSLIFVSLSLQASSPP